MGEPAPRFFDGFHRSVAAFADAGNNLILEHILDTPGWRGQLAVLLEVYLMPPPHTVRGLAAKLEVTKPVITRALDTMGEQGLVSRVRDEKDRRSVVVRRTVEGALFLERFGDLIIREGRKLQN